jgi:very-short-patch-repair endonuclease
MGELRLINTFAARQYGCFNVGQAREAGFDRNAVGRRLANGSWVRVAPRVYAVASAPPIWERQLAAAVLSAGCARVAGATAARLHGFHGDWRGGPVIMVPSNGSARSPVATIIRSDFYDAIATHRVKGFEVTSPAETVFTLASTLDLRALSATLDDVLLTGKATVGEFTPIFDRVVGRRARGAGRLRRLIEERHPDEYGVDSTYLERLLERVLSNSRIPPATREFPMTINGSPSRVDAFIARWDLVVEADSRRWHARTADFEADRARDNALAAAGIQVLRFTYRMLKDYHDRCIDTILAVGAHQSANRIG